MKESGGELLCRWFGGLILSAGTEALSMLLLYQPESFDFPSLGLFLGHKMVAIAPSITSSHNLIKIGSRRRPPSCDYFYQGIKTF